VNEPEDYEAMHDGAVARLVIASAEQRGCIAWVGGRDRPGSRVCGHSRVQHVTVGAAGIARARVCLGCRAEGVPVGVQAGLDSWSGYDHPYIDHVPPQTPASASDGAREAA
jgi:hypothetical protein